MKRFKQVLIYFVLITLAVFSLFGGFLATNLSGTKSAKAVTNGITISPVMTRVTGTNTIVGKWDIDFDKVRDQVIKQFDWNPSATTEQDIQHTYVEVKFVVSVDGKPLNDVTQCTESFTGGILAANTLTTETTSFGQQSYNGFDGSPSFT